MAHYNSRHRIIEMRCGAESDLRELVEFHTRTAGCRSGNHAAIAGRDSGCSWNYLQDPRFLITLKLNGGPDARLRQPPGCCTGANPSTPRTGGRHLQGCYLDTSEVLSRMRMLERDSGEQEDPAPEPAFSLS